jgi:peptidoglycan/LPS O-acetylase OafA/YrhL
MAASSRRQRWQAGREATDRRLRLQIVIFSLVFAVVTVLVVVRVVSDGIDPFWPLLGFAAGLLIGVILARSKRLSWNASEHEVVGTMSVIGIVVTIAYLVLMVMRDDILDNWVSDTTTISVAGLAVTGGVMLGRTIFTLRTIRRQLMEAGILSEPPT